MLKRLARLERTRNIVIIGFVVLMAVSLIVFYAPGRSASNLDPSRNTEAVAKVGSDTITVADLARERDKYAQMFGGRVNLSQLGGNKRFLDGMISKLVIKQEAERLGLGASDVEVAEKIRKTYVNASGVFVGDEKYTEMIKARYGDVEKFENEIRGDIAQEKLRAFVTASVNVSDGEVEQEYKRRNSTFDVSYIAVTADKLATKIQPSDEELHSYYESHKTDYRYLEPQKKVRYVFISTEKVGAKLNIPDADLKAEYDNLKPEFKEAGFKIQQILLKVARKDLDAQVEQKAKDIIAKVRGAAGGKGDEAAFAEAAKGKSEDPATAQNGGFLAKPFKRDPNKVNALYDRVADMQPGEISDIPIRFGGNWYILRRGDSVQKTFEEAKPELLVSLRNRRGYGAAFQVAQKAHTRLQEMKDPQKVATEFAGEANMTAPEMVRETPFVKPGDDVPEIGSNQQFEQTLEPLANANDVGEVTGVKGGFAIPMLVEKREPRVPDFDEVKSKVSDAIKQQRAKEQLEQKAKDLAATVSGPDGLKAQGEKEGFDSGLEESFKLGSSLGKAGISPQLDDLIYNLKSGEVSKTPLRVEDRWVIVGVTKKTDADMTGLFAQRDTLKQSMMSERQDQVFEDYIAGIEQKMKRDGKITIDQKVLAQLQEDEPAAEPILPGGFNPE